MPHARGHRPGGRLLGIMSPSAAAQNEVNLSIYIDGRAGDLSLNVGPVREPLNYEPA